MLDGCGGVPVLQSGSDCFKAIGADVKLSGACSGEAVLFVKNSELKLEMTYSSETPLAPTSIALDVGGATLSGQVSVGDDGTSFIRKDDTNYNFPISGTFEPGKTNVNNAKGKAVPFDLSPTFEQTEDGFKITVKYTGDAALGALGIIFVNASLNSPSGALATWAIVLIVLAVVGLLGVIAAVVFVGWYRKCRKAKPTVLTPDQYIYGNETKTKGACGGRKAPQQPFVPPVVEDDPNSVKPAPVAEYTARTKPTTTDATTEAATLTTDPEFERLAPALAAHYKKEVKNRRSRKGRNKKVLAKREGQKQAKDFIHVEMKASSAELERAQKNSDRVKAECKKLKAAKKASSDRIVATTQKAEAARGEWLDAAKTAHSPTSLLKSCVEECQKETPVPKSVEKPAAGPSATDTVDQAATTIETPAPK